MIAGRGAGAGGGVSSAIPLLSFLRVKLEERGGGEGRTFEQRRDEMVAMAGLG